MTLYNKTKKNDPQNSSKTQWQRYRKAMLIFFSNHAGNLSIAAQ